MATWPPADQTPQRWYLGPDGTLGPKEPPDGTPASFRYDPADPTPSVGGAILALNAGVRDNRPVEKRPDVLLFTSEPLDQPVEVIGGRNSRTARDPRQPERRSVRAAVRRRPAR